MRDLIAVRDAGGQPAKVLYPDPVLTAEESADLEKIPATFRTPTSLWGQRLAGKRIGLSIGDPDPAELIALGLSKPHIDDASRIIARMVLAAAGTVVYGGTLHDKSLTECMFEMIAAYQRVGAPLQPLRNITPWPWWHDVDAEWRVARRGYLEVVKCPPPKDPETGTTGNVPGGWKELIKSTAGRCDLIRSLSGMRRELAANAGIGVGRELASHAAQTADQVASSGGGLDQPFHPPTTLPASPSRDRRGRTFDDLEVAAACNTPLGIHVIPPGPGRDVVQGLQGRPTR